MSLFIINTNGHNMHNQVDHGLPLEDSCALITTV